jgi:hypothetical protein
MASWAEVSHVLSTHWRPDPWWTLQTEQMGVRRPGREVNRAVPYLVAGDQP